MVFSDTAFLFAFLPITILVYFLLDWIIPRINTKFRCKLSGLMFGNCWLLIASIFFYGWAKPEYALILISSIALNYFGAIWVDAFRAKNLHLLAVWATVIVNLALLFFFKHLNLAVDTLNLLLSPGNQLQVVDIVLPIGISFFTLQGISYVIDVYRNDVPVQRNFLNIAIYIAIFPKLIAGPIVRYADINTEIDCRNTTAADFSEGIERFIIGLFKKVLIADTMALVANPVFSATTANLSVGALWIGMLAYAMQIFFDFSGYCDMAVGLGRIFGFHFTENFNYPYTTKSVAEFWQRWHISLSAFFRNYIYIPLGGNKKRVYLNTTIVFLLAGIWHGSAYTFIAWGIWHCLLCIGERLFKKFVIPKIEYQPTKAATVAHNVAQHVYTCLAVSLGWVIFRAESFKNALVYIVSLFGFGQTQGYYTAGWFINYRSIFVFFLALLLSTPLVKIAIEKLQQHMTELIFTILKYIVLLIVLLICVMAVISNAHSPFIYFHF